MKYVNTGVVFQEIPDEVTLSINISNCPCHCLGCHSEYLWEDIGTVLNNLSLDAMLYEYGEDITCVCFMGGDREPEVVNNLANHTRKYFPHLKIGWYSGQKDLSSYIDKENFDYIKIGPFVERLGGLNKKTTNQRLYKIESNGEMMDITYKFWKTK